MEQSGKRKANDCLFAGFSRCFLALAPCSCYNHPVRPRQHIRRDRQADLLRGFQIDDEFGLSTPSTGRSLGLTPVRMRWTYFADRRPTSWRLTL